MSRLTALSRALEARILAWPACVRLRQVWHAVHAWGACPPEDQPSQNQSRIFRLLVQWLFFLNLMNWLWMSRSNFRRMATMDFGDIPTWTLLVTLLSLLVFDAAQNFGQLALMLRRHAWVVVLWGSSTVIQFAQRRTFWPSPPPDMLWSLKVLSWGHYLTWMPQIPLVLALCLPSMLRTWLWPSWPVQALRRTWRYAWPWGRARALGLSRPAPAAARPASTSCGET